MPIPIAHQADADAMPPVLRELLDDELAVGNEIVEVGHSHPAPPVGAYFKLARAVSSRSRESGHGVDFSERHSSISAGEFTDANRRYWILEPPLASDADYPDKDGIRVAAQPKPFAPDEHDKESDLLQRFDDSTQMNYDRWKEGTGYDLQALASMSPASQRATEARLTPPSSWRDVEALAALDTPTARQTLQLAVRDEPIDVRLAVLSYASALIDDATRTDTILLALTQVGPFAGRTETLDLVMEFHPPIIVQALFVGLLQASGEMAYHYAAALAAIHGVVDSRHDWSLRPLYLAFNTDDAVARRDAFLTLCSTIGVNGADQLAIVNRTIAGSDQRRSPHPFGSP